MQRLVDATKDLRVENGNLSAGAIADAFGVSRNELAHLLQRSRQSVSKAPAANSLQEPLLQLERVARLRLMLTSDIDFRAWLKSSNLALGGAAPIQWVRAKRWQQLGDFVDDLLMGNPG